MKKVLLLMTVAIALSLEGCDSGSNYKAKSEELSKQLDEKVEMQDTAAALATDEAIRNLEANLIASGDTAALKEFRASMKDVRVRNAAFVTLAKIHNGLDKEEALQELIQDALNSDVNIQAVTSTIDVLLKAEQQQQQKEKNK